MTLGFGNNVVSALASEITASQKTIPVMPGTGAKFAQLLTQDNVNSSTALNMFAKITLTDAGETEFEICHLLSVSGDVLTVVRGQEKTEAKGWMLNDVVANFATRGSENQFVQVEHLQSGFYCAGVAGGSANALTLNLPASFFLNGTTDWILRTPVIVYPTQNNTGSATLQLTMGGKVLGTFPLYKGDKKQLAAKDILKDVPLVCLLDNSKTFFNVTNPGAIYAGLGTAAFRDVGTAAGNVMEVGAFGLGGTAPNLDASITLLADPSIIGFDATWTVTSGYTDAPAGYSSPTGILQNIRRYYNAGCTLIQYLFVTGGHVYIRTSSLSTGQIVWDGVSISGDVNGWRRVFDSANLPTAAETGAFPLSKNVLAVDLNTLGALTDAGVHYQTTNASATTANHYPIAEAGSLIVTPTAYGCMQEYTTFGTGRKFVRGLSAAWNGKDGPWHDWVEYLKQKDTAAAATKLATAHKIAGHPFDGTADISISAGDVSAYTKTEANELFSQKSTAVIGLRVGARGTIGSDSGASDIDAPIGNFITGRVGNNGDVRYGRWYIRSIQINVNGTWQTITD